MFRCWGVPREGPSSPYSPSGDSSCGARPRLSRSPKSRSYGAPGEGLGGPENLKSVCPSSVCSRKRLIDAGVLWIRLPATPLSVTNSRGCVSARETAAMILIGISDGRHLFRYVSTHSSPLGWGGFGGIPCCNTLETENLVPRPHRSSFHMWAGDLFQGLLQLGGLLWLGAGDQVFRFLGLVGPGRGWLQTLSSYVSHF